MLGLSSDGCLISRPDGGQVLAKSSTLNFPLNKWTNFVNSRTYVSEGAKTVDFYQDGKLISSVSFNSSNIYKLSSIAAYRNNSYNFACSIGSVSVYQRTLTADEVRQNYEATKGRYE